MESQRERKAAKAQANLSSVSQVFCGPTASRDGQKLNVNEKMGGGVPLEVPPTASFLTDHELQF